MSIHLISLMVSPRPICWTALWHSLTIIVVTLHRLGRIIGRTVKMSKLLFPSLPPILRSVSLSKNGSNLCINENFVIFFPLLN